MTRSRIERILAPDSIAVVGASADEGKRGNWAIRHLQEAGYGGAIYPVNPNHDGEIRGLPVYPAVSAVPGPVDLAYVLVPAPVIPDVIADWEGTDVAGAVVVSAGFSEAGEGDLERRLVEAARAAGVRVIGPNVIGFVNAHERVDLGAGYDFPAGDLALLSQSGNLGATLSFEAQRMRGVGFSVFVSMGNEADLRFDELLPFFESHDETGAVMVYAEGMADGRAFLRAARAFTREKPIVALRGGTTEAGRESARSHTASLAGRAEVIDAVYRQAGVTRVAHKGHLLAVAHALANAPPMAGHGVAVVTEGGGHATMASDALVGRGLSVPDLGADTRETLRERYPGSPNVANPVDTMVTWETAAQAADTAEDLLADPAVDGLLVCGLFGGYGTHLRTRESVADDELASARRIAALPEEYGKPVVVQSEFRAGESETVATCRELGLPVCHSLDAAAACLEALAGRARHLETVDERTDFRLPDLDVHPRVAGALEAGREWLAEDEARSILADYGVPVAPGELATDPGEAADLAAGFGGAVAMKVVSPDIQHRTEMGGVALDVTDPAATYRELVERAEATDADPRGVLVSPMLEAREEVIVGATRDPEVGPVAMFGLGGVSAEVLDDVAFRALPLTERDARDLIGDVRAAPLLAGHRGGPGVDRAALVDLLLSVSRFATENPVAELDLNPVFCFEDGLAVVDAAVRLDHREGPDGKAL